MEVPLTTINVSRSLSYSLRPKSSFAAYHIHKFFLQKRFKLYGFSKQTHKIESKNYAFSYRNRDEGMGMGMGVWEDSGIVEVIGIGSRKDALLDFCLASNSVSQRLRFWNIVVEENSKARLQQRLLGDDPTKTIVKEPVATESRSKAVILVAGASYGSDLTMVHDIFEAIKLANGFLVTIILKPFRFEGRRRQDEWKVVTKLVESDFCKLCFSANLSTIFTAVIDADVLLEKDLVTLDEALQIANKAVLMALNAVSILTSEHNKTYLDIPRGIMKELGVTDLKKLNLIILTFLEATRRKKLGMGSVMTLKHQSFKPYNYPFIGSSLKMLEKDTIECATTSY
ncbi:protein accumulation and replication of chloroplasts 3 isoform X1 [Tanacetum coccineum]